MSKAPAPNERRAVCCCTPSAVAHIRFDISNLYYARRRSTIISLPSLHFGNDRVSTIFSGSVLPPVCLGFAEPPAFDSLHLRAGPDMSSLES